MINGIHNIIFISLSVLLISACSNKPKPVAEEKNSKTPVVASADATKDFIEGIYETQPEADNTNECRISVEIKKTKNGLTYLLKTKLRELKGKATFGTNESGEKYIVLEGIRWDDYEGDISQEEDNDSISDSKTETKQLDIPIGIDASYTKDTLTIQNYGNSMNSYTKISECDRKYIELVKK